MKSIVTTLALVLTLTGSFAQSKSYQILREKFAGTENVFSFRASGFVARTILWIAKENDYQNAIQEIRNVRVTIIPKAAFRKHDVTVSGFLKLTKKDGFEELAHVREHGEEVTILLQKPIPKNEDNRYLVLVEEGSEVVVMEILGYLNPNILLKQKNNIAHN